MFRRSAWCRQCCSAASGVVRPEGQLLCSSPPRPTATPPTHPLTPPHPSAPPRSYDGTVRNAVGEVMQFLYGEDGMEGTAIEGQRMEFLRFNRRKFAEVRLVPHRQGGGLWQHSPPLFSQLAAC